MRQILHATAAVLLLASSAAASADQAVGQTFRNGVTYCTCVVIHRDGWALSADHCQHDDTLEVQIDGRRVKAVVAYDPPGIGTWQLDHVSLLKLAGGPFRYVATATSAPAVGEKVESWGYPAGVYRYWWGTVLEVKPDGDMRVRDPAIGGHSGGPLFNSRSEVVGILSATTPTETLWMGLPKIAAAMQHIGTSIEDGQPETKKPVLWVLSIPECPPCLALKREYEAGRFPGVEMRFRDPLSSEGRQLVDRIEAATGVRPNTLIGWPFIWREGSSSYHVGYKPGTFGDWLRSLIRLPITGLEEIIGQRIAPGDRPVLEPIPYPEDLNWADVELIGLAPMQDVGEIRGEVRRVGLYAVKGMLERLVSDVSGGKASLRIVAERIEPQLYGDLCVLAEASPVRGHVLILVKRQSHGLRSVARTAIVNLLAGGAPEGLQDLPVDLIPELTAGQLYGDLRDRLQMEDRPADPPADEQPLEEIEGQDISQHTDPPADEQPAVQTPAEPATETGEPEPADEMPVWWAWLTWLFGPSLAMANKVNGKQQ